jgi:uncharacterized repeat protein (TIGR01451 family)
MTAINLGPGPATGVTIENTLPAGVTVTSTSVPANCRVTGPKVDCQVGTLVLGAAARVILQVGTPTEPGVLTDRASVSSDASDPNRANDSAHANTTVVGVADLSIQVKGSPNPVKAGKTLTYTLTLTSAGPSTATSVSVQDTLPGGAGFVSGTTSLGGTCQLQGAGTVHCDVGVLASGATVTITLTTTAPATPGPALDTATVTANESDPISAKERTTIN